MYSTKHGNAGPHAGRAGCKHLDVRSSMEIVASLLLLLLCSVTAVAQIGFTSINCGGGSFVDPRAIRWQTDDGVIGTGGVGLVQDITQQQSLGTELRSVRFFPKYQKNCYTISAQPGFSYLIRAGFYYGNYDGAASKSITFDMSLDSTEWETVNLVYDSNRLSKPRYYEAITSSAHAGNVSVCLIRLGADIPFINSLEARLISSTNVYTSYFQAPTNFYLVGRTNFGEKRETYRYPDDPWDRIWPPYLDVYPELSLLETISAPASAKIINSAYSSRDEPPSKVIATAVQGPVIAFTRQFPFTSEFYGYLFFAELNQTLSPTDRRNIDFLTSLDDSATVRLTSSVGLYSTYQFGYADGSTKGLSTITYTLSRNETSTLDPIVNAEEMYGIQAVANGTRIQYVNAMLQIKAALNLVQWVGDPCLPVPWDGIICSQGVDPTIASLILSGQNLDASLPLQIGSLESLKTLLLDNNKFSGVLPKGFSSLTSLVTLNVSNNGLSGLLPDWLLSSSLKNLTFVDISNNNFTGTFPDTLLSNGGLQFSYAGNPFLACSGPACPISPPPPPSPPPPAAAPAPGKKKKSSTLLIVAAAVGGTAVVAIIAIVGVWVYCCWYRNPAEAGPAAVEVGTLPPIAAGHRPVASSPKPKEWSPAPSVSTVTSTVASSEDFFIGTKGKAQRLSLPAIKNATTNFHRQIGEGSFGAVFYGILSAKKQDLEIAVKVLATKSPQGEKEFVTEIEFLSMLHHKNLVQIVGYCQDKDERILVYEYMAGSDLGSRLHGPASRSNPLSWRQRLHIVLDAAQGLEYLHHGCKPSIIHRDVKSTNILLGKSLEAKVSDFGLSKVATIQNALLGDATIVRAGTAGHEYIDPEFFMTNHVTTASDVYSFGVILLEVITGRSPILKMVDGFQSSDNSLVAWARSTVKKADLGLLADPLLQGQFDNQTMWGLMEIAVRCTDAKRIVRPTMTEIVQDITQLVRNRQR